MNNNYELTISIPTYNRQIYLKECLTSISNQTFKNFCVIIFDNASNFDIRKMVSEFPDLNIVVKINESNIGNQNNFKNILAYEYETPYVMIFHDDDAMRPSYIEKCINVLNSDSNIKWVGSSFTKVYKDKSILDFEKSDKSSEFKKYNKIEIAEAFMDDLDLCFSSIVYRKETFKKINHNIDKFGKWFDRPYLVEAAEDSVIAFTTFPYINYRIHPNQDSAQKYRNDINEFINFTKYYKEICSNKRKAMTYATRNMFLSTIDNYVSFGIFLDELKKYKSLDLYKTKYLNFYTLFLAFKRIIKKILNKIK